MLNRRNWLLAVTSGLLATALPGAVLAASTEVAVSNNSVGAIAAATCGPSFQILIDASLQPWEARVAGRVVDIGSQLHPAGTLEATATFLDDPRSAPKLGVNLRKAVVAAFPDKRAELAANHKAWSRPFVRKIMDWSRELAGSSVRGKRVVDAHNRAAALAFAGATIVPRARRRGPAGLAQLPAGPVEPTL
ncbi:MAG: hypothetical protein ACPG77_15885, partial [Nannocystaceae bacterium]